MIAVAITSVALLTMIGVYTSGARLMARARDISSATQVARQVLETVKEGGYHAIPTGQVSYDGRSPDPIDPILGFPPAPYPATKFNRCELFLVVRCQPVDTRPLKAVTVEVYYDDESHVTFQTFFKP